MILNGDGPVKRGHLFGAVEVVQPLDSRYDVA